MDDRVERARAGRELAANRRHPPVCGDHQSAAQLMQEVVVPGGGGLLTTILTELTAGMGSLIQLLQLLQSILGTPR